MSAITAWRIVKKQYVTQAFDGMGAKKFGERWNSIGTAMIYTSSSLSLATLEILVHLPSYELLKTYQCISIEFDKNHIEPLSYPPQGWKTIPPCGASQTLGDFWARNLISAVLKVPSVVIPSECNYLINPNHPDFPKIRQGRPFDFPWDARLQ